MSEHLSRAVGTEILGPEADDDPADGLFGQLGWTPSPRARRAEQLAQIVLSDPGLGTRLRELVRAGTDSTGAETGQISIVSTRQIALVVEKGVRRRPGTRSAPDGLVSPFHDTLCAVSVRADAAVAIADAKADARVASLPAVAGGVIASYLGCPIKTSTGDTLGVLCVYNSEPRDWTEQDAAVLADVAADVSDELAAIAERVGGVS